MKIKGKVPGSSPNSRPIGIPREFSVPCSNRFQDLSVSEFNFHDDFAATPGPAETIHAKPDSCSRPPHGGSATQSCISLQESRNIASASSWQFPDWDPPEDPPIAHHSRGNECSDKFADGKGPKISKAHRKRAKSPARRASSSVVRPLVFRPDSNSSVNSPGTLSFEAYDDDSWQIHEGSTPQPT